MCSVLCVQLPVLTLGHSPALLCTQLSLQISHLALEETLELVILLLGLGQVRPQLPLVRQVVLTLHLKGARGGEGMLKQVQVQAISYLRPHGPPPSSDLCK